LLNNFVSAAISMTNKKKSPLNRSIIISESEIQKFSRKFLNPHSINDSKEIINKTICGNFWDVAPLMPSGVVDLLIIDPPYNLNKSFNTTSFKALSIDSYAEWVDKIISGLIHILKKNASVYFCCDWHSSISVGPVLEKYFYIRNRITWEREKGRGAKSNWKNNSEDIWFCTLSRKYLFNSEHVKLNRRVIAPYKDSNGEPKDWKKSKSGSFRLTFPSNIWTDISVPFWSMPENTDHPTQKPEKLLAKLILASSNKGDLIFDPFLGSGTTSVVAKKLGRNYLGIEIDRYYAALAEKRLEKAENDKKIQGYEYGRFWERNSLPFKVE